MQDGGLLATMSWMATADGKPQERLPLAIDRFAGDRLGPGQAGAVDRPSRRSGPL
jgi:hypothetical protein